MPSEPHPGARWVRSNWEFLGEAHRFEWVAATASELVAHNRDLQRVIDAAIERDLIRQVVFAFVNAPEQPNR